MHEAPASPFMTSRAAMGQAALDLDRALQLAGELEDEALVERMLSGS